MSSRKKSKKQQRHSATTPPTLSLPTASDEKVQSFLAKLEKFHYGDRWGAKHCILELDANGEILSKLAFGYDIPYDRVLDALLINPLTVSLVMMSEAWSITSTLGDAWSTRASTHPNRQEVRTLQYVDQSGRCLGIVRQRSDNSILRPDTSIGRCADLMAATLGVDAFLPDKLLAHAFVRLAAIAIENSNDNAEQAAILDDVNALLHSPNVLSSLAQGFKEAALEHWIQSGGNPESVAAAIRNLFYRMPMAMGDEHEIEVRAAFPENFMFPEVLFPSVVLAA